MEFKDVQQSFTTNKDSEDVAAQYEFIHRLKSLRGQEFWELWGELFAYKRKQVKIIETHTIIKTLK